MAANNSGFWELRFCGLQSWIDRLRYSLLHLCVKGTLFSCSPPPVCLLRGVGGGGGGGGGGGERIAGLGVSISASGAVLNCHRGTESFRIEARIIKCVQDN